VPYAEPRESQLESKLESTPPGDGSGLGDLAIALVRHRPVARAAGFVLVDGGAPRQALAAPM